MRDTRAEHRPAAPRVASRAAALGLAAVAALSGAWAAAAVWHQIDPPLRWLSLSPIVVLVVSAIALAPRHRRVVAVILLASQAALAAWWVSIRPSNDRDWDADVARGVTADIAGSTIVLHNVRNFTWRSETSFTQRWETRSYSLDDLTSVDLISSVWGNPAIAHTLISMGFSNGEHVVFSAEIRRERGEAFSEIGGFFKQFELVFIAADERDIIRLRTNIRKESVTLLPLLLSAHERRDLLLSYLQKANDLDRTPEFYQTITSNCTTVLFQLARRGGSALPIDWRILLSGYLPDYLYDHGMIRTDRPLEEIKRCAAISARARLAGEFDDFSRVIRSEDADDPLSAPCPNSPSSGQPPGPAQGHRRSCPAGCR